MGQIYYISGLGADERVFQFLTLDGQPGIPIKWVRPEPNESLTQYAGRLLPQIDTNKAVILLGVSFGGVIAQEMARLIPCQKVIILSSIKSPQELSWQLTLVKHTKLYGFFPPTLLKGLNQLTADYYFGTESASEKVLLQAIIQDTDEYFMQWAIHQLLQWQGLDNGSAVLHIHGTKDRIFPIRPIRNALAIAEGSHFMIVNRSAQISEIINQALKPLM